MNTEPLTTLKGIGEKTEKLFAKVGIYNLQQLLHYYPRDYDCYAEPVPLRECRQEEKNAVYGRIVHSPSVKGNQRKSVVVLELYEEPVRLADGRVRSHGIFSYTLARAIDGVPPADIEAVAQRIRASYRDEGRLSPHPAFEGALIGSRPWASPAPLILRKGVP